MKVHALRAFGLEHLRLQDRPDPSPGPGQVLLRVKAVSLNYRDLLMVKGLYNPRQVLPLVPCSDACAVVEAVGDRVTRVKPGDRVIPSFVQDWIAGEPAKALLSSTLGGPLDGTLAERMVVPEHGLVHAPEHLSDTEAATLPCAGLTAWTALDGVTAGETVLVQGTGGVSLFALQLAVLRGARVICTSSSDAKLALARNLGAAATLNYVSTPSWGKAVRALTHGRGVDRIIEVAGGDLAQSLRAIRAGGTISLIGILGGAIGQINLTRILMQAVTVRGILVGHRDGFEAMNRAITQHQLRPVVDKTFDFVDARIALEYLGEGKHFGKVVLAL
jgi:NADPH:quinone reductase-like Zn-dependent oxidoreductase